MCVGGCCIVLRSCGRLMKRPREPGMVVVKVMLLCCYVIDSFY